MSPVRTSVARAESYYLCRAVRAHLLRRLGRPREAVGAHAAALQRAENGREREFLQCRIDERLRVADLKPPRG